MMKVYVVYDGTKWEISPPEKVFMCKDKAESWIKNHPTQNWEFKEIEVEE